MATALRALTRGELVADGVIHVIGITAGLIGAAILVIAAISKRSRNRLHSQSISAVLPEPTGPPTPTRNGPFTLSMASPFFRKVAEK